MPTKASKPRSSRSIKTQPVDLMEAVNLLEQEATRLNHEAEDLQLRADELHAVADRLRDVSAGFGK